jgi:relaxase-like protein
VIGKVLRGSNAAGLLYYLYGPGRANEHTNPHLIAGFGDPAELEPEQRPGRSPDIRRLAGLLAQPLAALPRPPGGKPVWHCSVRAAPGDRVLTDAEWAQVAVSIMDRTGLAPAGDERGVRWVAVRHADDHIHLVATLARQDGTRPSVWNDYYRVREACRDAEWRLELRTTAPADRTAARRATRAETEQTIRRGWGEPPRARLRREVCTAAAGACSEREFFARLAQAGVLVRQRRSTTRPGQVTGYAVGLPEHQARNGKVIWYGGGKLAADLTLPKLRARWAGSAERDQVAEPGVPERAVRGVLRTMVTRVATQARDETSFFAGLREDGVLVRLRFSEIDPAQVTGYSVTLPGHDDEDGAQLWYGGGRLAADLTLPRLRQHWTHQRSTCPGRAQAWRLTAAERDALYRHAARNAKVAAEHIRQCALTDPGRAADPAWAVADSLHIAARALCNPALRRAADSYDRAARAPYGQVPARSADGQRLRRTVRLLALAGDLSGSGPGAGSALLGGLAALAVAVADLRQAQQHAAQATAARTAAAHLHEALKQAQAKPVPATPAQARRPTADGPAQTARHDVPAPLDLSPAHGADPRLSRPHPRVRQVPLPPRRAGPHP